MSADMRLGERDVNDPGPSDLGSVDEPAVSDLAARHWRETFEGRSTFQAWLYRIATGPLLDELSAVGADEPEALAVARLGLPEPLS